MRRFFVPSNQIHQSHARISGEEFHHLCHVLRLHVGDHVSLYDDSGKTHEGIITSMSATTAEITITNTTPVASPRFSLTLAVGLLKGQKMDLVVEKVTELGVDRIVPFTSTSTVSQLSTERQSDRLSRWQRIAHSAAKQSGSRIPEIQAPQTFAQLCDAQSPATTTLLLYEHEQQATLKTFATVHPHLTSVCAIVGSEGGFVPQEVELARQRGLHVLGLGPQLLRAETASIVAVALCRFLWDCGAVPPLPSQANKT